MPHDAAQVQLQMSGEMHEIARCAFQRVRRRCAERLTVSAQIDQDKPPVGTRFDDSADERAKISAGTKDAVQHEHVASRR